MIRLLCLALLSSVALLPVEDAHARRDAGDLLWQDQVDLAGGEDIATAVAAANRRVVVVGTARNAAGNRDVVVRAYDGRDGGLIWTDRVDLAGAADRGAAAVMDGRRVVVTGASVDATGTQRGLLRTYVARTGALMWEDTWLGSSGAPGVAMDGPRIVATEIVVDELGVRQLLLRAYVATTGEVAWEEQSRPAGFDVLGVPTRGVVIRESKVFVAATIVRTIPLPDGSQLFESQCLVRAHDLATGRLLWQAMRTATLNCRSTALAADGRQVIVTAGGAGVALTDYAVQAFDADTGQFLWQDRTFSGINANTLAAVDSSRRETFVAGWRSIPFAGKEAFVVRSYDTETGTLRWETLHAEPERPGIVWWHGFDVEVERGRVYAIGQEVFQDGTWLVRAYDARDGHVLWEDQFQPGGQRHGAPYGGPAAIALDGGRVFAAGSSASGTGDGDMFLRAYDAR